MKKYILPIILVIALIIVLIVVKPKTSKTYKLELESNATTGFSWSYTIDKSGIVEFVKNEYVPNESNESVGVGGKQIYEIKGISAGTVTINFEYKQQWDAETEPEKTKTITLVVDKNLNIKEK